MSTHVLPKRPPQFHFLETFFFPEGWLAIAELKSLSLFISLLLMLTKEFDNVEIEE